MSGAGVETCCGGGGAQAAASSGPPPRGLIVVSAVFLSIFFATFLTLMSLAFCCCRRWRERDAVSGYVDGEGAVVVVTAGADSGGGEPFPVEALPPAYAYVVGSSDSDDGGATAASGGGRECAVCLGAVREGEMVRRLPACEHVYHADCIDRWLGAHRTCPLCRRELDPGKLAAGAPPAPAQQQVDPTDQLPV